MPYTAITHDSRHPFQILLLVAGTVAGIAATFGGLWPRSIEVVFPDYIQTGWGIFMLGGSALSLWGIATSRRENGILMEQVGLVAFGFACVTYAIALAIYNWEGAFVIAIFLLLIAVASGIQFWRLERAIRAAVARGARIRSRREKGKN